MTSNETIMVISCHTHSLFWFRIDMMREFLNRGYRVVAVGQEDEKKWSDRFLEYGITYRKIDAERNGTNPIKDLRTYKSIKKIISEEKPDKIFCYQAKTVIYGCMAAKKKKITEVYPLIAGLGSIFLGQGLKNKILCAVLKLEYKYSLKQAKRIFFQNPDDVKRFVGDKIISADKICMINGSGVDTSKFLTAPIPTQPAFLLIARLIRDKGVMEYLNAARIVKNNYPNARFLLVGPFDTNPSAIGEDELSEYVQDGTVEYFGEQADVLPYIQMSSVYVLPSYHEGTPKTVLEAMSCARPVITTDAPGCRETVIDGENGFLVPVKDANALAKRMEEFILNHSLCEMMGKAGRRIAEEKFDIKKVNHSILSAMELL